MLEWEPSEKQPQGFSAQLEPGDQSGQMFFGEAGRGWHQGGFKSLIAFVVSPAFPWAFL